MQVSLRYFLVIFLTILPGCSATPPMEAVTGTPDSPVFIKDVVDRVKCELAGAFGDKLSNPEYYWLRTWTVKADLTLIVTDSGSLTPSVATTEYSRMHSTLPPVRAASRAGL